VCNGYYGPNFGEPLCGACHAFLYNAQRAEELLTELSDDEDSGNDEPPFKDKQEDEETENDVDIMGFEDLDLNGALQGVHFPSMISLTSQVGSYHTDTHINYNFIPCRTSAPMRGAASLACSQPARPWALF